MKLQKRISIIMVCLTATVFVVACGNATPTPTQIPDFKEYTAFYSEMQKEKEDNPTRVDHFIDLKKEYGIVGAISEIDGSKVQFHIGPRRDLKKDLYIECEFSHKSSVLSLNKGDVIRVSGKLNKVNSKIELKNCKLWK